MNDLKNFENLASDLRITSNTLNVKVMAIAHYVGEIHNLINQMEYELLEAADQLEELYSKAPKEGNDE